MTTIGYAQSTGSSDDTDNGGMSNGGMSTGAIVGVAVAVPVAVVLMAGGVFVFWWRRRKQRKTAQDGTLMTPMPPSNYTMIQNPHSSDGSPRLEMESTTAGREYEAMSTEKSPGHAAVEAPAHHEVQELGSYTSPTSPAELPADRS